MRPDLPIGVFDSGIGGLTVAAAIRRRLPSRDMIYLGDTARLPYGTKSPQTVRRYAEQATRFLVDQGVSMLVVACNTASAHALSSLIGDFPHIPVLGVIEAGARMAAQVTRNHHVGVAATEGTCRSGAFEKAILARQPQARVVPVPCPLFVALAEEGLTHGPIVDALIAHYLGDLFKGADRPDTLVLGCTHFPVLKQALAQALGGGVQLVDCAQAVAEEVARLSPVPDKGTGRFRLMVTDAPDRVEHTARLFFPDLDQALSVETVNI